MAILAIDCSTRVASITVISNGDYFTRSSNNPKSHSDVMNVAIQECLDEAGISANEIEKIGVAKGPGSFTGIRVALSLAKTLSYSLNCPIYEMDTLSLLAANNPYAEKTTIVMTNAHKNMVFFSLTKTHQKIIEPCAITLDQLHNLNWQDLGQGICIGDGYEVYQDRFNQDLKKYFLRDSDISDFPNTQVLAKLVQNSAKNVQPIDWKMLQPLYLRASEAEENLRLTSKS